MSDHDLRDLLREQVAAVTTTPDLSAGAWTAARRVRLRRRLAAAGGAAAATVLVLAGIAVLGDQESDRPSPAPAPSPTRTPAPREVVTTPDGRFQGAPVYWSPSLAEEAELPVMEVDRPPLPEEIDLSAEAPPIEEEPVARVAAAFAVLRDESLERLVLLTADGGYRTLDISSLQPDPESDTGRRPPVRDWLLSPTGEYLVFPQLDDLQVYDLPEQQWRTVRTEDSSGLSATWIDDTWLWLGSGAVYDVRTGTGVSTADPRPDDTGLDLGRSYEFGPGQTSSGGLAQSWASGARLPVPEGTRALPEFLVAASDRTRILVFTGSPAGDGRWLQCCSVVGWLDDDTVMYESRSSTPSPRIIAWSVGTHRFETVSTITGFTPGEQGYLASYARYWK